MCPAHRGLNGADVKWSEYTGRFGKQMDTGEKKMTESLMEKPYWVIDILPEQIPGERAERYFAAEKYWLQSPALTDIRQRFTDVLLKLNCYSDYQVCFADADQYVCNPAPELLASWILTGKEDLCIVLPGEDSLITLNHDDLYMTVYHPSEKLLDRIRQLVSSSGLFLRQPEEQQRRESINGRENHGSTGSNHDPEKHPEL